MNRSCYLVFGGIYMVRKNEKVVTGQIELFPDEKDEKVPRNKDEPAYTLKNTDASASAFGWRFQIVAAIVLSIRNIKDLKKIEVEGCTEDIELYFKNRQPEYVQVKAVQRNPLDATDNDKAIRAMNTLINTSNLTKGKYSKLVYLCNFRNPLNLSSSLLTASWIPSMKETYSRDYGALPEEAKNFLAGRIELARKDLGKKYSNSIEYFDLNKLYIATILFGSDDKDEQQYSVLSGTISNWLDAINVKANRAKRIENMLVNNYLADAGSKENSDNHKSITKEILVWRIIFEIIKDVPEEFYDDIPSGIVDDLEQYETDFIKDQSERIEVINKVISGINVYAKGGKINVPLQNEFIDSKWRDYEELFPMDEDSEVKEFGIKMILLRIINGRRTISKIKRGAGIK